MDEKDLDIQKLKREVRKWKDLFLDLAEKACFECGEYRPKDCQKCRFSVFKEEARDGMR